MKRKPIAAKLRQAVIKRDGSRCWYCGQDVERFGIPFDLDHKDPRALGGLNSEQNLVAACSPCNTRKSDRTVAGFRSLLRHRVGAEVVFYGEGERNPVTLAAIASAGRKRKDGQIAPGSLVYREMYRLGQFVGEHGIAAVLNGLARLTYDEASMLSKYDPTKAAHAQAIAEQLDIAYSVAVETEGD